MIESYKNLLDKMRLYLAEIPYEQGTRGYQKRIFVLHYDEIRKAEQYLNQKDLVEKISADVGIEFSHTYVNRILSKERKKREQGQVTAALSMPKPVAGSFEEEPSKKEEHMNDIGKKSFPKYEVTPEKLKEWEHLDLPKVIPMACIIYGVSVDEYEQMDIGHIKCSSTLARIVNEYCIKKESDWKHQNKK